MRDNGLRGPEGLSLLLLLGGAALAVAAFFMPAISFESRGAVHELAIFDKLPLLSLLAFAALGAAVATRLVPSLAKWSEQATVLAVLVAVATAIWGFMVALDAWSSVRATMLQIAGGARTVKVNPDFAYLMLAAAATMMAFSLRLRSAAPAPQSATTPEAMSAGTTAAATA